MAEFACPELLGFQLAFDDQLVRSRRKADRNHQYNLRKYITQNAAYMKKLPVFALEKNALFRIVGIKLQPGSFDHSGPAWRQYCIDLSGGHVCKQFYQRAGKMAFNLMRSHPFCHLIQQIAGFQVYFYLVPVR